MHDLDFLDYCALLLGILFTLSKLDAQGRKAGDFPRVPPAEFERWRLWTTSIYRLGASVCFARELFHLGEALYIRNQTFKGPAWPLSLRLPAAAMDLCFLAVTAITFIRASRARALRQQLGIVLTPLSPSQAAAYAPDNEHQHEPPDKGE